MCHRISLFAEDTGHEEFLNALCRRLASDFGVEIRMIPRNVRGGHGKALTELKEFLQQYRRGIASLPELLIVATDANCVGYNKRKKEIDEALLPFDSVLPSSIVVSAIPDPHIERWALLDSVAFKQVLGRGCQAPDYKCERDRYKELLARAVRDAGVTPLLGGIEHFEDIVNAMDLDRMETADKSLGCLVGELRGVFRSWQAQMDGKQ